MQLPAVRCWDSVLPDIELIGKRFTRSDAIETDTRHAVHMRRQNHSMPVDRGVMGQVVRYAQCHTITLPPAKDRARHGAVDSGRRPFSTGEIYRLVANIEIETFSA